MITDWRLAEALAIQRLYGDNAALRISLRCGALMLAGDMAGVERMQHIAAQLNDLLPQQRRAS